MKAFFLTQTGQTPIGPTTNSDCFRTLLENRFQCSTQSVSTLPDESIVKAGSEQVRKTICSKFEKWTASLRESDTAIICFSISLMTDEKKQIVLPTGVFDGKDFKNGSIPLSWFVENLNKSKAKVRLILLDSFFESDSKHKSIASADSEQASKLFASCGQTAILTACRSGQRNCILSKEGHSLFIDSVTDAFRGNADKNGNQLLDYDEICDYVQENVHWTSNHDSAHSEQEPFVLHCEKVKSLADIPLPAQNPDEVIANFARQILGRLKLTGQTGVLVPEFTSDVKANGFDPAFGALPRELTQKLRMLLSMEKEKKFKVFSENATRELLERYKIKPSELGTSKTEELRIGKQKVTAIVSGRIEHIHANAIKIVLEIIDTEEMEQLVSCHGTAILLQEQTAQTGASFVQKKVLNPGPPKTDDSATKTVYYKVARTGQYVSAPILQTMKTLNLEKKEVHPILNKDLPFEVKILVSSSELPDNYFVRNGKLLGNNYYVPLDRNECFAISLTNKKKEDVFVKVLVDGLNTVSQRMKVGAKGLCLEPIEDENGMETVAPRVGLEEAWPWLLYGTEKTKGKLEERWITGFVQADADQKEESSTYRFKITDADKSQAARQNYTEQIGLITIAFYEALPPGSSKDVGTSLGQQIKTSIEFDDTDQICGNLIVVYNVRYVSTKKLDSMKEN